MHRNTIFTGQKPFNNIVEISNTNIKLAEQRAEEHATVARNMRTICENYLQQIIALKQTLDSNLNAHANDNSNPHNVSASQVNSYSKSEMDSLLSEISDGLTDIETELGDYVTETELNSKGYLTSVPSEYITETELNSKGYLTSVPSEYITETELNSKGYLTSVPSGYINVSGLSSITDSDTTYVENNVIKARIPDCYTKSEINSMLGSIDTVLTQIISG